MFPASYFPKTFFPGNYFPPAGGTVFSWLARDVAVLLAGAGAGTLAVDLFVGGLPVEPVAALAVIDRRPGRAADWQLAGTPFAGVALEYPVCEVLCRATTYEAARTRLETAYRAIVGVGGRKLGRTFYAFLEPVSAPYWLAEDEGGAQILGFEVEGAKNLTRL